MLICPMLEFKDGAVIPGCPPVELPPSENYPSEIINYYQLPPTTSTNTTSTSNTNSSSKLNRYVVYGLLALILILLIYLIVRGEK